jgi:iron complex transport system ATP-binding protein
MDIEGGSVTAVIGPNGSGKSTFLKGIMSFPGMLVSGEAVLDSVALGGLSRRERARRIGYLPQFPPVPPGLTGIETVLLGRHPHRSTWSYDSPEDIETAANALDMVGASHLAEKYVDRISGGEFRLVNLAGVLAQETPVILLDEPGSSLDYGNALHLWMVLSQLADQGKIIIAATHRIGLASGYFSRVLLLSGGRPVEYGTPAEVFAKNDRLSEMYRTPLRMVQNTEGRGWSVCPVEE